MRNEGKQGVMKTQVSNQGHWKNKSSGNTMRGIKNRSWSVNSRVQFVECKFKMPMRHPGDSMQVYGKFE